MSDITIPPEIEQKIDRLVDDDVFINKQRAVNSILRTGIKSYTEDQNNDPRNFEEEFIEENHDDEYIF